MHKIVQVSLKGKISPIKIVEMNEMAEILDPYLIDTKDLNILRNPNGITSD